MTGNFICSSVVAEDVQSETGIDEKNGNILPLYLVFSDEEGKSITLSEIINKPVILTFVYYRCPGICSPLLMELAKTIEEIDLIPGKDFSIVTLSFDETENPLLASEKKRDIFNMIERDIPYEGWRFITGKKEEIKKITDSAGFRFKRDGANYIHPGALIFISGKGRITRYLYGKQFLPFDIKMGLVEAAEGKVGHTINRILPFCFSYDPKGKKYVFNVLKMSGIVMGLCLAGFIFFLVRGAKSEQKEVKK